jgi:hypothetical protein
LEAGWKKRVPITAPSTLVPMATNKENLEPSREANNHISLNNHCINHLQNCLKAKVVVCHKGQQVDCHLWHNGASDVSHHGVLSCDFVLVMFCMSLSVYVVVVCTIG